MFLLIVGLWLIAVPLGLTWWVLAWRGRRGAWNPSARFTRPLNVITTAWFGIATVTAVMVSIPPDLPSSDSLTAEPRRNVYAVLLDAYPRADTLMEYFDFDNRAFLDALEERGFAVANNSHSHYPSTIQVVPTMMYERPLDELIDSEWEGTDDQYRQMWRLLNAAPVPQAYRDAGYTTYSVVSGAAALDWRTADVVLESPWLSALEEHLLRNGLLSAVLPFDAMHRASILDTIDNIEATAGTSPRFVFAHVMSPHDPYVFAADGSPAKPCGFPCQNHVGPPNPMLADREIGQITFLNGRILQAVDHIITVDPEATVIVFSDHGIRRDRADMAEWFRTLFAARNATFPDDIAVTDVFAVMLRSPVRE